MSSLCLDNEDEQAAQDRTLGVPINQVEVWRRLARKRKLRASSVLKDTQSAWTNLLWQLLAKPVMNLHWSLFKRATGSLDEPEEDRGPCQLGGAFSK